MKYAIQKTHDFKYIKIAPKNAIGDWYQHAEQKCTECGLTYSIYGSASIEFLTCNETIIKNLLE